MIQESCTAYAALLGDADYLQKESSSSGHTSKTSTNVGDAVSGTSVSSDRSRGGGIWADWAGVLASAGSRSWGWLGVVLVARSRSWGRLGVVVVAASRSWDTAGISSWGDWVP